MGSRRVRMWFGTAIVAAVALVAGCASVPEAGVRLDQGEATGATTSTLVSPGPTLALDPPATGPARPSPGCTKPGAVEPFDGQRSLKVSNQSREYLLHVPAGLSTSKPAPLVLDLHGLGTNAAVQSNVTGWNALSDREGLVVAHPQGLNNIWTFVPDDANPDIPYLRAVATTIGAERCIDLSRTYATGLSMGGLLSSALACRAPEVFAAFGLVAGIQWKPECQGAPARPAIVFWGTKDCVLPYFGGMGPCLKIGPPGRTQPTAPVPPDQNMGFPPVEEVLSAWATHSSCTSAEEELVSPTISHRVYRPCTGGATIEFYLIDGGSHSWPGSKVLADIESQSPNAAATRGTTTIEIDATQLIWAFFQRYQLPAS